VRRSAELLAIRRTVATIEPRMLRHRLAVVILNLNGCEVLRDCLASVFRSEPEPPHIIVVDNGSTDGSTDMVRNEFPQVQLIATGQNLGFAGGNNVGLQAAIEAGFLYVALLNNDTIVDPQCFAQMLTEAEQDATVGAVTPLILFAEPADRIWCAGGSFNLWYGIARHYGLRGKRGNKRYLQPRDVTFATGCALLLRTRALTQVGFLDESLFAYHEDAELSWRLVRAGWKIRYAPKAVLWHREGWSSRRSVGQTIRLRLCVRNILIVHRRYASWYHRLTFWPCFVWRWIVLAGLNALLHRRFETLRGIFLGVAAYCRGEIGKPKDIS